MKLYIPTCTLNFNNIFSTESISPKADYLRRGFGNKRFYSVEANCLDGVVLLYSKYPRYTVEDTELENYPMVIEIESEDYPVESITKQFTNSGVDVFASASTIYLNPFHSKVYFDSYAERQGVLTKAAQSLENKFEKLYGANLVIKEQPKRGFIDNFRDLFSKNEGDEFDWDASYLPKEINADISNIEQDRLIDHIKGFVYCYLIGANMTVSSDVAELKSLARKMRNTLSAIINSPTHTPSESQDESLTNDIKVFNQIYMAIDEDAVYNANVINMRFNNNPLKLGQQEIVCLLEWLGVYTDFCSKLNLRRVYDANDLWKCVEFYSPEAYNNAIDALNGVVRKLELRSITKGRKNDIKDLVRISHDRHIHVVDSSVKPEFYDSLVNSQIYSEYESFKNEKGVDESLSIAFIGGRILKQIMGEKWENSKWASYINDLLNHLQESSAFDLYSIDNEVLNSFAAFCQKGDNIDRLSEYLVQCGFRNYRIAFGLYGATRGFASLPKTFTSILINGDKDYYKDFALELYAQLFGIRIKNAEFPIQCNSFQIHESQMASTIIGNIGHIEPKSSKQTKVISAVNQALELEDAVQSPKAFMYIADNILGKSTKVYKALKMANFEEDSTKYSEGDFRERIFSIIESSLPKSKSQRSETIEKINKVIELEAKRQDSETFLFILDNLLDKSSAAYRNITKMLNRNQIEVTHKEKSLVDNHSYQSPSFLRGRSVTSISKETLPSLPSLRRLPPEVYRRLEQNWKFTGISYKDDRREHIRFFINLCKKEGRGESSKRTSLYYVFTAQLAEQIEKELLEFYGKG